MASVVAAVVGVAGAAAGAGQGIASTSPTHREIIIDIQNATRGYCMINPRVHLISGGCRKPLPLELDPGTRDNAGFVKTPHTACGTVGVFTYDLSLSGSDPIEKMALMFSVPYDYTYFENWFAVGVFSSNKICNYDLYNEMYYNNNNSDFVRGRAADGIIKYIHGDFVIKVSMSDSYTPYMRLKVKQKKNT